MVTVQTPEDFLSGQNHAGSALSDVELRLGESNVLEINTQRLAKVVNEDGFVRSIEEKNGWWKSGDIAEILIKDQIHSIKIIGRRDTAINSGGETVFPERLRVRLLDAARKKKIPIDEILLMPIKNEEWGERLVALVKIKTEGKCNNQSQSLLRLKDLVKKWHPFERPIVWHSCPELSTNSLGKWEMDKWQAWIDVKDD